MEKLGSIINGILAVVGLSTIVIGGLVWLGYISPTNLLSLPLPGRDHSWIENKWCTQASGSQNDVREYARLDGKWHLRHTYNTLSSDGNRTTEWFPMTIHETSDGPYFLAEGLKWGRKYFYRHENSEISMIVYTLDVYSNGQTREGEHYVWHHCDKKWW